LFKNSEKTFKQEVDKNCKDVKIVQVNFTKSGNLVIEFEGDQDYASFQDKFTKKFSNLKIHKISKKEQELQIVIKGLNYKTAKDSSEELESMGIISFGPLSGKNEEMKIIKATCQNKEIMINLISNGVKLFYRRYHVDIYEKPIKPIQCFNCQKFGHISTQCNSTSSKCVKCGDTHKASDCKIKDKNALKCANCGLNHTSNFAGCSIYQEKLRETMEKITAKNTSIRVVKQFSQVVKTSNMNDELVKQLSLTNNIIITRLDQIDANIKSIIEGKLDKIIENKIDEILNLNNSIIINSITEKIEKTLCEKVEKKISEKIQEIMTKKINPEIEQIKNTIIDVKDNLTHFIIKNIYHNIDLMKIVNNKVPTIEDANVITESLRQHKIIIMDPSKYYEYVNNKYVQ